VKYLQTSENDWLNRCDTLELYPFLLAHEPLDHLPDNSLVGEQKNLFRLCGHVHPKVKLVGLGKQQISMPCFHFSENQGILPSFGQFTGGCFIKVREGDRVIGVMNDKIYPIGLSE
jgi:metallophosphoesterase superfamily enzyme